MTFKISIIVATANNGVIGLNNQMPWHLPQDLKYFKAITSGKPVIMGRKTYESIGRPLPGRTNIVVTRSKDWIAPDGVIIAYNLQNAITVAKKVLKDAANKAEEAMIIGGAQIYNLAIPLADRIYLTKIDLEVDGDTFFPSLSGNEWQLRSVVRGDDGAHLRHQFLLYERASLN